MTAQTPDFMDMFPTALIDKLEQRPERVTPKLRSLPTSDSSPFDVLDEQTKHHCYVCKIDIDPEDAASHSDCVSEERHGDIIDTTFPEEEMYIIPDYLRLPGCNCPTACILYCHGW